ncbi:PTS sugar transporter subunit IIB [Clostridium sp. MB40-C1]|uniref:PTS sugar transporter subunit IIB n=1 Tax=Clostridium sp. MB40-C1 TaxID=3070996 RepID=UPI0027DF6719|nr:PTS sugar transporter subunit IIB [Clostridium sp. MB40-C1]WMJ81609.1 PTS sugar transporter subunit IIB [Clostridium sp. MB40-C1]
MIKLVRVDHRLLHGQVAFSWMNSIGGDSILIASDEVVKDEIWKTTLKLGKPSGVKLVIKNIEDSIKALNSGVTDKYKLLIVVQTIKDVARLVEGCPQITTVNLGGVKDTEGARQISKAVFVTRADEEILKNLMDKGIEVEIRQIASEKKIDARSVL